MRSPEHSPRSNRRDRAEPLQAALDGTGLSLF